VGELIRPLVGREVETDWKKAIIVLFLSDMYRLLDPSAHSVAFSVDDFGLIPIYDVVEGDSNVFPDNLFAPNLSGERRLDRPFRRRLQSKLKRQH